MINSKDINHSTETYSPFDAPVAVWKRGDDWNFTQIVLYQRSLGSTYLAIETGTTNRSIDRQIVLSYSWWADEHYNKAFEVIPENFEDYAARNIEKWINEEVR